MVGFSLFRFRKYHVPMYFMGLFGGFFLGIFISLAFQSVSGVSNFYVMAFSCGIMMTFTEYKAYEANLNKKRFMFKLWATSIIGSYLIMRGFSTVVGGYPSEIRLLIDWSNESKGQPTQTTLPWTYYIYLAMQIVGSLGAFKV